MSFIDAPGGKPKPNRWVKPADGILASVRRFCLKANGPGASLLNIRISHLFSKC